MIRIVHPFPKRLAGGYCWHAGDALLAVDGKEVEDLLDLYFYQPAGRTMRLTIRRPVGNQVIEAELAAEALPEVTECLSPLDFKTCACKCVFCFVDQNPPGMRPSIYVKDEDYRLSFLYGNYVTLTSLGRRGLQRIVEQNLSPIYVSVHATDIDVRTRMLGLRRRIDVLKSLRELRRAGITVHAQIVLCPGWNDGEVLERSYRDLLDLAPQVASVAVVPVGLTEHRRDLPRLDPVTPQQAAAVIATTHRWQQQAHDKLGAHFIHLSDEFYLLAGHPFPAPGSYDDFPQVDNGIGLTVRLRERWRRRLEQAVQAGRKPGRALTILTGQAAKAAFERDLLPLFAGRGWPALEVIGLENRFYGSSVTVAGLLTGRDIQRGLQELPPSPQRTVVLCEQMFNHDGLTLDDLALHDIVAEQPHRLAVAAPEGFVDFWIDIG